jgi:hypothetical protein
MAWLKGVCPPLSNGSIRFEFLGGPEPRLLAIGPLGCKVVGHGATYVLHSLEEAKIWRPIVASIERCRWLDHDDNCIETEFSDEAQECKANAEKWRIWGEASPIIPWETN